MKLTIMSDLHGYLPEDVPECDVVCICGDISPLRIQRYTKDMQRWFGNEFAEWIQGLPCKHVLLVAGNHDFLMERHPEYMISLNQYQDKLIYLEDDSVTIEGKTFYGTPWCPDLYNWAYYGDHNTLVEKFLLIPENVDVLLTHCPPDVDTYGTVLQDGDLMGRNFGCVELAEAVDDKHPKYHFFGHVHSGLHTLSKVGETTMANVSIKDENYNATYPLTVVEI